MNNQLFEYIKTQISAGYSIEQIKTALVNGGYSSSAIDSAIQTFNNATGRNTALNTTNNGANSIQSTTVSNSSSVSQNINMQLVQYIYSALQKGYDVNTLYTWLLKNGYLENDLNSAIAYLNSYYYNNSLQLKIHHEHSLSTGTIFKLGGVFTLILLFFIGGFFAYTNFLTPKLLDVSLKINGNSFQPGDDVNYNVELTNQGSGGRFDATIISTVFTENNFKVISNSHSVAMETFLPLRGETISLPSDLPPGKYDLDIVVVYEGKEAYASKTFTVVLEGNNNNNNPNVNPDSDPNNNNPIINPQVVNLDDLTPIVNDDELTDEDLMVRALSYDELSGARGTCAAIVNQNSRDYCLSRVAENLGIESICNDIESEVVRNDCHMYFVLVGSQSGVAVDCDTLPQGNERDTCLMLQDLSNLNNYLENGGDFPQTNIVGDQTEPDSNPEGSQEIDITDLDLDDVVIETNFEDYEIDFEGLFENSTDTNSTGNETSI